jgi:hypothetical protein
MELHEATGVRIAVSKMNLPEGVFRRSKLRESPDGWDVVVTLWTHDDDAEAFLVVEWDSDKSPEYFWAVAKAKLDAAWDSTRIVIVRKSESGDGQNEEEPVPTWLGTALWGLAEIDCDDDVYRLAEGVLASIECDDLPDPVIKKVGRLLVVAWFMAKQSLRITFVSPREWQIARSRNGKPLTLIRVADGVVIEGESRTKRKTFGIDVLRLSLGQFVRGAEGVHVDEMYRAAGVDRDREAA